MEFDNFLNENDSIDMDFEPNEKLRKSVYEIVTELGENQQLKFAELSEILKRDYKINISGEILKEILDSWDLRKNYSVFKKQDDKWLDVWGYAGYIKRKARFKQNFGKHRNRVATTWPKTSYVNRRTYVRNGVTYIDDYDGGYY